MKRYSHGRTNGREAFTLAEVLVASAIFVSVMAVTLSVFLTAQRLLEGAMAQTQMAFELRMLREKLLFRVDRDGGLMSARQATVALGGVDGGWGSSITFRALDADEANTITLEAPERRLAATRELAPPWLGSGQSRLADSRPFRWQPASGVIEVDANVELVVGGRTYGERQSILSQVMSP